MLEVKNLKKRYGEFWAVQSATFSLNPGDIMGFIGSNGAGKTTTIKMLATLLEPTAGEAYLDGLSLNSDDLAVRRKIGYMPDFFGLYENIRVWEYLDMFATMYAVPKTERPGVIDQVLDLVDLRFKKDAMAQSLSRGMQQRLCLARCLVHDPLLLLLDEPASGLDPRARAELKGLITELGKMGKIVIVSSHILPELADFCSVVGIIERGEMMAFGPVEQVVKSVNQHKMLEVKLLDRAGDAGMWLHGKEGVARTVVDGAHRVRIEFEGDHDAQYRLLQGLVHANFGVIEFREESADLEDLFMKVTTGALN